MHLARRILPLLALAVLAAAGVVVGARPVEAQVRLVLSDFDQTGLEMELLALVEVGEATDWYTRGRFGSSGTLVDGELGIGPTNSLIRIRNNDSGRRILLNHDSAQPFNFNTYFSDGGDGRDLTLYIQTSATEVIELPVVGTLGERGGGYVNFNVPAANQVPINAVAVGDRFIIAFARPSSNVAPVFAEDSYSRSVSEAASTGTNLGDPITATDVDHATLGYTLTGTGAADFAVSGTGQITVARALDYETTASYSLTLTATDGAGATDTATVVITVTDHDERPIITPDPEGQKWVVGANQEFDVANTIGVQSVTVSETGQDRTGDLTLQAAEAGITCGTQVNSLSVDTGGSFWARFCTAGTLTLRVEDNAESSNVREYKMTVSDQANRDPSFSSSTATRSVNENVAPGTNVGTPVTADEPDSDPVTYSISGSDLFSIVPGTGQIQVASGASLNYEVAIRHTVTVTAQDNFQASDTITVTINVGDLDDAPELTPDPSTLTAYRDVNQQFTVSLPANAHPTQNVTVDRSGRHRRDEAAGLRDGVDLFDDPGPAILGLDREFLRPVLQQRDGHPERGRVEQRGGRAGLQGHHHRGAQLPGAGDRPDRNGRPRRRRGYPGLGSA